MKLYLAGPLFSTAERDWNQELAAYLIPEHTVWLPQWFCEGVTNPEEIAHLCLTSLDECDIVVVNCDGADMDSGTSMEFGYALGIRKPTVGYRTDFRRAGDCDKDVNLMIGMKCDAFLEAKLCGAATVASYITERIKHW